MRLLLACAILALARAAVPEEQHFLLSIPNTPDPKAVSEQLLTTGFDVRGVYSELVVVVGNGGVIAQLEGKYPLVDSVGAYTPSQNAYFVVMRTALESDSQHTSGEWNVAMLEELTQMDSVTVMSNPVADRIFVSVPIGADAELMRGLLFNAEVLEVLPRTVVAPATFQARHSRQQADIATLISQVSQTNLRNFANDLSGEAANSSITTRNSYSIATPNGILLATSYIQSFLDNLGFETELHTFRADMGPNVIAVWPGSTDEIIVLGAHYDSRGIQSASPTADAPGANDDGSGSAALMEIARVIATNGARFRASIHLNFYCGEEQGLIGSGALAQRYLDRNTNLIAMLQADMIAYRLTGPNQLGIALDSADEELVQQIIETTAIYVPDLTVGRTGACCSDQRSFYVRGYSTAQFFENMGNIQDPQYHRAGDVVNRDGFSFDQMELQTQSVFASAAVIAGLLV